MPRKRQSRRVPTPSWERGRGAIGRQIFGRSAQAYATAGIILLIVFALGLVGFAFASDYVQKQQRPGSTAVKVGDQKYSVSYFSNRLKAYVGQIGGVQQFTQNPQLWNYALAAVGSNITDEAVILKFAPSEKVTANDADIKNQVAQKLGIKPDDPNFNARETEDLKASGLSQAEYNQMNRAAALRQKLLDKFTAELPKTAESVHYRQILVDKQTDAEDLQKQVEGGADFAALAKSKSKDTSAKDNGGDQGWVPRGYLDDKAQEDGIFALEPGKLTTYATQNGAYVFQVLEKQKDRPIEDAKKGKLAQSKLKDWLKAKQGQVSITNNMDPTSGDSDKIKYAVDFASAA